MFEVHKLRCVWAESVKAAGVHKELRFLYRGNDFRGRGAAWVVVLGTLKICSRVVLVHHLDAVAWKRPNNAYCYNTHRQSLQRTTAATWLAMVFIAAYRCLTLASARKGLSSLPIP